MGLVALALLFASGWVGAQVPDVRAPRAARRPRALAWCVALLSEPVIDNAAADSIFDRELNRRLSDLNDLKMTAERPETVTRHLTRAAHRLFTHDPARVHVPATTGVKLRPRLEGRVAEAWARLDQTRRDLMTLPPHQVPVRHVVRGEVAVRAYVQQLRARAVAVERRMDAALPEGPPVPWGPKQPGRVARTGVLAGTHVAIASLWAYATFYAGVHHHALLASGMPFVWAYVFGPACGARLNRFYLNLRGGYAAVVGGPRADADLAGDMVAATDDILRALDPDASADTFIYASTRVALPLRQWDSYEGRRSLARTRRPAHRGRADPRGGDPRLAAARRRAPDRCRSDLLPGRHQAGADRDRDLRARRRTFRITPAKPAESYRSTIV